MEDGSTSGLLFIDVEAKPPIPVIKEERSSSPDEKLSEIKDQNNAVKLHCSECSYSTALGDRMTRHIRKVHRGENPYQCAMCDYSAYNSTLFAEHVNIHKGVKPYKCSYCSYRSVSKKYIKLHEQKHGSCDKCGFVAHNRRDMKRHRRETGCGAGDITNTFRCDNCDQSYDNRVSLKQHKKNHKACYVCGKAFSHQVLITHLAAEHGIQVVPDKTKKIKFECGVCDWNSNCNQKILLHIIHHPDQTLSDDLDITPLVKAGILPARIKKLQP